MGRPPKPTAEKLRHGNPGKRPLNEREPKFNVIGPAPKAPKHLTPRAKKLWAELLQQFGDIGLVTGPDRYAFATYCQAAARAAEAEDIVSRDGMKVEEPVVNRHGNDTGRVKIKAHPLIAVALKYAALAVVAGSKFGLDPSSRTRIALPEKTEDTDDEPNDASYM